MGRAVSSDELEFELDESGSYEPRAGRKKGNQVASNGPVFHRGSEFVFASAAPPASTRIRLISV